MQCPKCGKLIALQGNYHILDGKLVTHGRCLDCGEIKITIKSYKKQGLINKIKKMLHLEVK